MNTKFKKGFTLAEVLITLGIIGVVAVITFSVIKHIRYEGYTKAFLKTYSELQQVHLSVVQEHGEPDEWYMPKYWDPVSEIASASNLIASYYTEKFDTVKKCPISFWFANECRCFDKRCAIIDLNSASRSQHLIDTDVSAMILKDGRYIGIVCNPGNMWGYPKVTFVVDVNGRFNKPNQIGRDIFFIALEKNAQKKYVLRPFYKTYVKAIPITNTCNKDSSGYSCADRILKEGSMRY